MTDAQFQANDALDKQRLYLLLSGAMGAALGVDTGADPNGANLNGQTNPMQVLSPTGTAPQGQAATLSGQFAGIQFNLPLLLVAGAAFFLLRK